MLEEIVNGQEFGPVEYIVVAFDGNEFKGEIIPALLELIDTGQMRIIDLAVVSRDGADNLSVVEVTELDSEVADALEKLTGEFASLLSEEDLLMVGDELPANTTAAAMLLEHVWATRFWSAIRQANGRLVTSVRIPPEVIASARQTLIEAAANM